MSERDNGGAAFPTQSYVGMTLRDYFAGQAMQGLLSSGALLKFSQKDLAKHSYVMADAMLDERK